MSYSSDGLSHGEKPITGWECTLVFRAPDLDEFPDESKFKNSELPSDVRSANDAGLGRQNILEILKNSGFCYSQLWVPAAHVVLVRVALPYEKLHEVAEKMSFELKLRRRFGGGYLEYSLDKQKCFVNDQVEGFFTPAQRLRINLGALESKSEWGAGINVESLIHQGILTDFFPLHDRTVRDKLLEDVVYRRWWDPFFRPRFNRIRDYLGARCTLYFAFLNFYTRMLIGISIISIPAYAVVRYDSNSSQLFTMRFLYSCAIVFWASYFIKRWKRRNAVLNVKWGNFDYHNDLFYEVRPQFVGNLKKGFYSRGGFVDLSDLENTENIASSELRRVSENMFSDEEESDEEMELNTDDNQGIAQSLVERLKEDEEFEKEYSGKFLGDLPVFPRKDQKQHRDRIMTTFLITALFIMVMVALTFLLIFFKADITHYFSDYSWGPAVPGVLTGVLIFCGENGWKFVYPILANWENHRTKQSYVDSLIMKRFSFEFVANYSSLLYIAFIKPYTSDDPCEMNPVDGNLDCMYELRTMVASLVITKATIQQVMELGIPTLIIVVNRLYLWYAWWRTGEPANSKLRRALLERSEENSGKSNDAEDIKESKLNTFDNTVEDYGELVIQFGYVSLFGLAYPLTAFVFFLNNVIEQRSDIFKYLFIRNRAPADVGAEIGKWIDTLQFLLQSSIWTNAGILIFTSDRDVKVFSDVSARDFAYFFLLKQIYYWITKLIETFWSDVPDSSYRRKARQDFLVARWFNEGNRLYYERVEKRRQFRQLSAEEHGNLDLKEALRVSNIDMIQA